MLSFGCDMPPLKMLSIVGFVSSHVRTEFASVHPTTSMATAMSDHVIFIFWGRKGNGGTSYLCIHIRGPYAVSNLVYVCSSCHIGDSQNVAQILKQ